VRGDHLHIHLNSVYGNMSVGWPRGYTTARWTATTVNLMTTVSRAFNSQTIGMAAWRDLAAIGMCCLASRVVRQRFQEMH
jgi:hypothetical protein